MPTVRSSYLISCFALSCLVAGFALGGSVPRQDTVWKRYYNANAGYCVNYPARWYKADAFDGSGLYVMSGVTKHSRATGEIDIGLFRNAANQLAHATNVSLVDDFESHVDGLKKFERAERVEVLEQRPMEVAGNSALFTKDRYYDPQDRSTWLEEVLFVQRNEEIYRVELECKADQAQRFERVFTQLVSTLQFDCAAAH
jgi:hypothetical protein